MPRPTELRAQPVVRRSRRAVLKAGGSLLIAVFAPLAAGTAAAAQILGVRVWPARDYTRVTLENDADLKATHFLVKDPDRLVVDIEGLQLSAKLKELVAKIQPNDPYIRQVRVGQNRPNVVRLVFDLKAEVNPQVFTLAPVGSYRHRLVFDLYPAVPEDPIAALIARSDWRNEMDSKPAERPAGDKALDKGSDRSGDKALAGSPPKAGERAPDKVPDKAPDPAPGRPADSPSPLADARDKAAERPGDRAPEKDKAGGMERMLTIALDPGHGGEDPGAIGRRGSREKDVVLAIARRLKARLESQPNVRVMMTRDADFFVPLHVRVQKARAVQADLFVSIHADAFVETTARGASVFALSEKGASSTAARWLANKENAADLIGGVNIKTHDVQLASVLLDLSTTAQINDSLKVGRAVLQEIGGINRLHKAHVEQAGFAVLKAPDIPSILVETAFISNPEEEAKLNDEEYQDQLADAIQRGIRRYFAKNPPLHRNRVT